MQERVSPRGTAGLLVLRDNRELLGKHAVQWAVDALVDGYDVPSIRILAGLDLDSWPNSFEADTLVAAALRELGVPETDRHSRAVEYVREVATAIVAGGLAPQEGANLIHRRVISPLDHPADLRAWCYLWEGNAADCSRSLEDAEIDQAIVDYATTFLRDDATSSQRSHRASLMTKPKFDQDFWEQLWSKTLREHGDKVAHRPPNAHLMAEAADLPPGRALDAGCGHGADTLWLAAHGWQVTAVDFSAAALAHGRSMAEAAGADVAQRIDWIESDLATWTAEPGRYDLVVCLYVHVAGSVEDMVGRMANGVAPGGTLFLVGHRPIDPSTGAATAAAGQVQVSVEAAVAALDSNVWELVVAEERPRAVAGTGVDAVIRACRRT